MHKRLALPAPLLVAPLLLAAAPPSPDARLRAIVAPVSAIRLRADVATLVGFGTRHTLSSQSDPKRGIGAALAWGEGEFQRMSARCGNCLTVARPSTMVQGARVPTPTKLTDIVAVQRGTERPNDVVIITGHIDSRVTDVMNADAFEPGANDDGSGSAAVLEAARVLSQHKFPGTIVYALLSGEEQGLYGGKLLADYAKAQGWNVIANLNNDIIGNGCGSDGVCDTTHVRVFSEGPRWQGHAELAAAQRSQGGENDSPSRNISRFLDSLADRLNIGLDVRQIWRNDRFGRGGDHTELLNAGYPAVRLSESVENYDQQHQDVRVEHVLLPTNRRNFVFGDTIDHMNFAYLSKVVKLNTAALASLASAPAPPVPKVEGAVMPSAIVTWTSVAGAAGYVICWRRTDAAQWEHAMTVRPPAIGRGMNGLRVDDWVFGVSSVSADGFESPVASAVPGGAFRPYVAPEKK